MLVWLLVGCCFVLMFIRIGLPFGIQASGRTVARVGLTFRERLLLHRTNMYALGALLVLSALGQWFSLPIEIALILVALAIVNLPIHYQFTSEGIACNNVLFRRWKEFEYVGVHGARLTLMPRKGYAPLRLVVQASRHKEVLPHFQRFLQVRHEVAPPPAIIRWLRQRVPALILTGLLIFTVAIVLSSCGEGPDASGLNSANQSNLTSVSANGTALTQKDLDSGKKSEPFAYNLALLVDENRLGINFVWTLVTGYLVMFMQAGFALRALSGEKCWSYDGDELHSVWPRHDRVLHCRFRFPVRRCRFGRHTEPGWLGRPEP